MYNPSEQIQNTFYKCRCNSRDLFPSVHLCWPSLVAPYCGKDENTGFGVRQVNL